MTGLARALGVPVPSERQDSPTTRVTIRYRVGHDETRHLMLGLPGEPIECAVRQTGSTSVELHSLTCNYSPDAAGVLNALAGALRGTPRVSKGPERIELLPMDAVPTRVGPEFVLPADASLSDAGRALRAALRKRGASAVTLVPAAGADEIDLVLLAAEADELEWAGRCALARLLADAADNPVLARVLWAFLREAKARPTPKNGTAGHETLVWAVAALSNADPQMLRTDPVLLERLLRSVG
jgi:hypothetical protein